MTEIPFSAQMFEHIYFGQTGNHQDDKIFLYGMHEPATIRFMRSVLRYQKQKNMVPVYADIGTNMGQHLIGVCAQAIQAYGFEPWKVVRDIALMQVQKNNIQNVEIFPFGLSDTNAHLSYSKPKNDNLGTGMFTQEGADILEVREGDNVFKDVSNLPTLMKIDTEGFEDRVMRGLSQTISKNRPVIVFEYSTQTRQIMGDETAFQTLLALGYRLYGIKPSREYPALAPFCVRKRFENVVAWPYDDDVRILDKYLD